MGYWDRMFDPRFMFDSEWKQRRDIDDAESVAELAQYKGNQAMQGVVVLQQQVHDLSITVMALVELLADAKQLDPAELRARVEAAIIGERAAAREAAVAASQPQVIKPLECTRCHKQFPPQRTTMTASGVVCDNCAR
ncbi:MAG TPA: hypothetical protein VGO00_06710 [Kofleriaceae bacterium]|jgi:hypothetical protein|nr:hypothetical protein [Kofleriaceae bacterium]